ncbi:MAG: hypothetical protein HKL82_12800 [Acidimicrobiaceae bacterium]|nr:hypothetical protein [Acidimicrobiaceae bacterium]
MRWPVLLKGDSGASLVELLVAMAMLGAIFTIGFTAISNFESQQSATYSKLISVSQAQIASDTLSREVRNADSPINQGATPIVLASPLQLEFYQQSYINPNVNRLVDAYLSPAADHNVLATHCTTTVPCSLVEKIFDPATSTTPTSSFVLGDGIVLPTNGTSTSSTSLSQCANQAAPSTTFAQTIGSSPGIFQFLDGCLKPTTDLAQIRAIQVNLAAQQSGGAQVTLTDLIELRNYGSSNG